MATKSTVRDDLWNQGGTKENSAIKDEYYTPAENQAGQHINTQISGLDSLIGKTDTLYNDTIKNSNTNFQSAIDKGQAYGEEVQKKNQSYADSRGLGDTTYQIWNDVGSRQNTLNNGIARENNDYETDLKRVQGVTKTGFENDKSTVEHNKMSMILDLARQIQENEEQFKLDEAWNQKEYDLDVLLSKRGGGGGGRSYGYRRNNYRNYGGYNNQPNEERQAAVNSYNTVMNQNINKNQNAQPVKKPTFFDKVSNVWNSIFGGGKK